MKILYVTTIGITMTFFKVFIRELLDEGHIVHIMCNEDTAKVPECYREWNCSIYHHSCSRSPLSPDNLKAVSQIRKLVTENNYDIVHCHTPVAAACTRLACRSLRKHGTRVFYTAHGFHFYKGAPLKNWLLYYPVEKLCAHFTDVLITINREDYERAKEKLKAKRVEYVPGVGIDVDKFHNTVIDRTAKKRELGVPEDAVLLASVGELIERKNHKLILQALSNNDNEKVHYLIVGSGSMLSKLQAFTEENSIAHRVHFCGYRKDIAEIYKASDICCLPSIHEGLPVALMEAMACGLPVVCSKIRGNVDLIDQSGGILFEPHDGDSARAAINQILTTDSKQMGRYNQQKVQQYSIRAVNERMKDIYERL